MDIAGRWKGQPFDTTYYNLDIVNLPVSANFYGKKGDIVIWDDSQDVAVNATSIPENAPSAVDSVGLRDNVSGKPFCGILAADYVRDSVANPTNTAQVFIFKRDALFVYGLLNPDGSNFVTPTVAHIGREFTFAVGQNDLDAVGRATITAVAFPNEVLGGAGRVHGRIVGITADKVIVRVDVSSFV